MDLQGWILSHLTAFRAALFVCSLGWWVILWSWLKPSPESFRKGCLAALVQFWVGLALDMLGAEARGWEYRPMPFSVGGVPLDLHLDWTLIWAFGLVWLAEKRPGLPMSGKAFFLYISLWSLLTLAFDAGTLSWRIFVEEVGPHWWLADLIFLYVVQAFTLCFYASMGKPKGAASGLGRLKALPPYARSWIYLSFFSLLFLRQIPDWLGAWGATPWGAWQTGMDQAMLWLALPAFGMGGWAVHEFAVSGQGTPLPWDHTRKLVRSGPYAFMANPMQASTCVLILLLFIARPSWLMAGYVLNLLVTSVLLFRFMEDENLPRLFGRSWKAWSESVKPWRLRAFPSLDPKDRPLLFYDGNCGLCQRSVRLLLALDYSQALRFAPLGGRASKKMLGPGLRADNAGTLYFHEPLNGLTSLRSAAVLRALAYTPLPLALLASLEGIPGLRLFGDSLYRLVAWRRRTLCAFDPQMAARLRRDPRHHA